jgi:hypothetical protein
VLVIEDNLCNNYCNISLKAHVEIFYISEHPAICIGGEKFTGGAILRQKFKATTKKP